MLCHVGLDPYTGNSSYYIVAVNRRVDEKVPEVKPDKVVRIRAMFEKTVSTINGKLGSACVCLDYQYNNEIRKKFIEEGLKSGYANVEIINWGTALYLNAMQQINYKPVNGNVIWIDLGVSLDIWQIKDQKAKYIGRWQANLNELAVLKEILKESKLNKGPDVVLYPNYAWETNFTKISPNCRCFQYMGYNNSFSRGSHIKARISTGDDSVQHLDVENFLCQKIILKMGQMNIKCFDFGQHLPITYTQLMKKMSDIEEIEIISGDDMHMTENIKIPNFDEFFLTFQIDANQIYSLKLKEHESTCHISDTPSQRSDGTATKQSNLSDSDCYKIPKVSFPLNTRTNVIGIDLGTSRCCAAVNRINGISTVPLDNTGERLLPSYVSYDEEKPKFGQIVIDRLRHFSKSTIFDSKRIIGKKMSEIEIDAFWPFEIIEKDKNVNLRIQKYNGKGDVSAEDVAAELLKHMKKEAQHFQGTTLEEAVIAVPAAFSKSQRDATLSAAKQAGWKRAKLLPEPIAAAFAYFIDRPIPNHSNVLLFDLGGGTLDVCIFKIENNEIQIISNTGDMKLGGRDFDTVLINYFKNALSTKYGINLVKNKKYLLMVKCQKIKESLSLLKSCSLDVDDFDSNEDGTIEITQMDFQNMSKPLLNKVKNTIQSALFYSKYDAKHIDKVLQVGGGSRMPMIKKLLKEMFPAAEHICEEHPDEVVAVGAAYYAYSINKQSSSKTQITRF